MTFEATFYTAYCSTGCIGVTATGIDVSETTHHQGKRVAAVDPSVIALGSTLEVRYEDGRTERMVAADTGGAINGRIIDILVSDKDKARQLGRQTVGVRVVD
ncbi:cell wall-binding protein [Geomicrobium sp. JCM 19037]|uniref:3D domain-containing protein n=1 Tax=Geomicrobium sp. JCM 19037 TaxID=1460634 RepID=UPI00045F3513|nr:3D domain-containing protein [Geomicrobium sp. JCM 19037]GAK03283.1 cell wall-binding protein [Geomicrobium sp. JCM 19037]